MSKRNSFVTAAIASCTAILLSAGAASSATLDFDGATPCVSTDAFVTLSTVGTTSCSSTTAPTTSSGAIGLERTGVVVGLSAMQANFAGLVSFVSVDMGDFGADADNIFLEVFDAGNVSLGFVDFLRAAASQDMNTLSITVAGIAYAVFGTNADDLGYIAVDNLTYRETSEVPIPAAGLLLLSGLGALGLFDRRRRQAPA